MERRQFWIKWTINCALGELIGIACAGSIAFLTTMYFGEPETIGIKFLTLFAMIIAGTIEGTVLSLFQWHILVKRISSIPRKEWMLYTIMVAVLGWVIGMTPSLFFVTEDADPQGVPVEPDPVIYYMMSIILGICLGALFGLFQWFVLKKYVKKASRWILANMMGWTLGMFFIFLFASIPDENSSLPFIILSGAIGGILAGVSVGIVTGRTLLSLELKP